MSGLTQSFIVHLTKKIFDAGGSVIVFLKKTFLAIFFKLFLKAKNFSKEKLLNQKTF
jgi:hypothetical protein